MHRLLLLLIFCGVSVAAQQTVYGKITDEERNPIASVLVMNMKSGFQTFSDSAGEYSITGNPGDEIRFVRKNYERVSVIFNDESQRYVSVTLNRIAVVIEEVKIDQTKLTGNLETDSKNLTKVDRTEILNSEIGVPKPPEKPREKAAEFKKDVLKPLMNLSIKPQAIYDLLSGDARRMKTSYRYDDLQDNILWIRTRLDDDYFIESGIPPEKIAEFIAFSFYENPQIVGAIKAKNLSRAMFLMEEKMLVYLQKIKS